MRLLPLKLLLASYCLYSSAANSAFNSVLNKITEYAQDQIETQLEFILQNTKVTDDKINMNLYNITFLKFERKYYDEEFLDKNGVVYQKGAPPKESENFEIKIPSQGVNIFYKFAYNTPEPENISKTLDLSVLIDKGKGKGKYIHSRRPKKDKFKLKYNIDPQGYKRELTFSFFSSTLKQDLFTYEGLLQFYKIRTSNKIMAQVDSKMDVLENMKSIQQFKHDFALFSEVSDKSYKCLKLEIGCDVLMRLFDKNSGGSATSVKNKRKSRKSRKSKTIKNFNEYRINYQITNQGFQSTRKDNIKVVLQGNKKNKPNKTLFEFTYSTIDVEHSEAELFLNGLKWTGRVCEEYSLRKRNFNCLDSCTHLPESFTLHLPTMSYFTSQNFIDSMNIENYVKIVNNIIKYFSEPKDIPIKLGKTDKELENDFIYRYTLPVFYFDKIAENLEKYKKSSNLFNFAPYFKNTKFKLEWFVYENGAENTKTKQCDTDKIVDDKFMKIADDIVGSISHGGNRIEGWRNGIAVSCSDDHKEILEIELLRAINKY